MPEITARMLFGESAYLAPEVFNDEQYMNDWLDKYFGIGYDTLLEPKGVNDDSSSRPNDSTDS